MSDFVRELLVRGIAAARTGDPKDKAEARLYLERVLRAPDAELEQKAKAWLWLSQVEDDPAKKRECLENVLAFDPSDASARRGLAILDGRLKLEDQIDPRRPIGPLAPQAAAVRRYVCLKCGGQMRYDAARRAVTCTYCGNRLTEYQALQQGALVTEQDFTSTLPTIKAHRWELATAQTLQCSGCGATFALPPGQISGACPFCGSAQIVELQSNRELIQPEGVVPFQIDAPAAVKRLHDWIARQRFRPDDLDERSAVLQPRGVYLPFWTFDLGGQMTWQAQVYEERLGQETWAPRSEPYLVYYDDLLVPATHSLPKDLLDDFGDFDTQALVPYSTELLADRVVEIYQVALADASLVARQRALQAGRDYVCHHNLSGVQFKDFHMNSLGLIVESYKLVLLPVWMTTYRYKRESYAAAINGQTGAVAGRVPRGGWQSALAGLFGGD
jgi:DNA-directed RNA polymerase subunit RPC12/RpoP